MREGMRMFRILAAPDMAAGKTYAKLVPRDPERNAFLAAVGARFHLPDRAEMFATIAHVLHSSIACAADRWATAT